MYAGGDAAIGPDSVIRAIAQGRIAASSIDKQLGGTGIIDEVLAPGRKYNTRCGKIYDFKELRRAGLGEQDKEERVHNFLEVEIGYL